MDPKNNSYGSSGMGFPPHDQPILAELADKPRRPPFSLLGGILFILVIVGLFVGLMLYFAIPGELLRWKIAAAEEKRLKGDVEGAIQDLNEALAKEPDSKLLLRTRARWRMEQKNYQEALRDCDKLLELDPDDVTVLVLRAEVLHHLGRHADAVADMKRVLNSDQLTGTWERASVLNGLAYARALANIEIDEGLADIDEAIRRAGERYEFVDTRGYLYYRAGDLDRALKDLNRAVETAEEEYAGLPISDEERTDAAGDRQMSSLAEGPARVVAVIRYHRALVHEARGDVELAEQDRKRIRELGFEPNDQLF